MNHLVKEPFYKCWESLQYSFVDGIPGVVGAVLGVEGKVVHLTFSETKKNE